jgi:hypothetical protein
MSDQATFTMPSPTAEHQLLQQFVGKWRVDCQMFGEPGKPPTNTPATETVEAVGQFWTIGKFEMSMMGAPFVGRCTLGFEPHTSQFVMTWVDTMTPVLCTARGSKKGDSIVLEGDVFSCMTKSVVKHRFVHKLNSKDEHIFEMFMTMPGGPEIKLMTNTYKRA